MTPPDRPALALAQLQPYIDAARGFSGWSFPQVNVRVLERAPWDYRALAADALSRAQSAIDLGTGGGELLAAIAPPAGRVVATEEWHVNAPVARDRLGPLGIPLVRAQSLRLPFRGACFDLVLDRHEELEPAEIARVLAPGGTLLTQQVDQSNWRELCEFLPDAVIGPDHFLAYQQGLTDAGMAVTRAERHFGREAYATLGDVVFMILTAPWMFPAFDAATNLDALLALEDALRVDQGITLTHARYIIEARKS